MLAVEPVEAQQPVRDDETIYGHSESTPLLGNEYEHLKPLTPREQAISRIQLVALCWSIFILGWNDGTVGPLLPRIQEHYKVGFATVSWVFILGFSGSLAGALVNMWLSQRIEFGAMLVFGGSFQIVGYALQASRPDWKYFAGSFFIGGFGMAWQGAHANAFIALLRHGNELKMGLLHASYGLGALVAPFSSTFFAQRPYWSSHYWTSFAFAIANVSFLAIVFRLRGQDECLREAGEYVPEAVESQNAKKITKILEFKATHLLALYLVTYMGIEVTVGAWTVTYMIIVRGGGANSGYVASLFFGGLTLGRVVLIWVNRKLGEIRAAYLYTLLAIICQLVVWLVPSFSLDAIAVFVVGIVLGPMYPIAMNHCGRIFPRALVSGTIGWIAACGSAGAAALPSVTGPMAEKYGIGSLQPFLVISMFLMGFWWYLVPKKPQRIFA